MSSGADPDASRQNFEVYGLGLEVEGDWPEVIEAVSQDFAWFARDGGMTATDVVVTIARGRPDPSRFGSIPQAFITTRNVVFQSGSQTIVDYSGRVLAIYDRATDRLRVEGEDEQLVHEATYLFMLSRIGRHLDEAGLMRIHALGLSGRQGAVLVLLPSGGGKTTLALRALRDPEIKLLSEDTPVLDRHGRVHPFPLRIGVSDGDEGSLPTDQVRRIERLEYGPKLLVSVAAIADRVESESQPLRHLVLGRRWLDGGGALVPVGRRTLLAPLLRDGVVGVGVAQMIEYVLRTGPADLLGQGGLAASRTVCCARALSRSRTWRLELSRDSDRNWEMLRSLLV